MVYKKYRRKKYLLCCFCVIFFVYMFNIYFIKVVLYETDQTYIRSIRFYKTINYNNILYEPIDAVYTWVNGSDSVFQQNLKQYSSNLKDDTAALPERFDDKQELRYSLRSIEKYAPWIRHIYIVTNGQIPHWLDLDYDKVTIITHDQIFQNIDHLPTFSSSSIECHLHRIPNLSDNFLYFNDDVFLNDFIYMDDFVTATKGFRIYLSWPLPDCNTECPWSYVKDGSCDPQCNNAQCQYDGGDCVNDDGTSVKYDDYNSKQDDTKETGGKVNVSDIVSVVKREILDKNGSLSEVVDGYNRKIMLINKHAKKTMVNNVTSQIDSKNFQNDAYAQSLLYVNKLYNVAYEFEQRRVIAHMPMFLNKHILNEMMTRFGTEFERTSKNRFRGNDDMQYAFSYYYYIVSETFNVLIEDIFDRFDTDKSGTWSDRELRTVLTKIHELPLKYESVDDMERMLVNCTKSLGLTDAGSTTPSNERYLDSTLPLISRYLVTNCDPLRAIMLAHFGKHHRFKFEIVTNVQTQYVAFKMLTSNLNEVIAALDEIRKYTRKFVCLNDNMNPNQEEDNYYIREVLRDFYQSLLPLPSKFELPSDFRNKFTEVDELNTWKRKRVLYKTLILVVVCILCLLLCCKFV